jgi:hypothetical protein
VLGEAVCSADPGAEPGDFELPVLRDARSLLATEGGGCEALASHLLSMEWTSTSPSAAFRVWAFLKSPTTPEEHLPALDRLLSTLLAFRPAAGPPGVVTDVMLSMIFRAATAQLVTRHDDEDPATRQGWVSLWIRALFGADAGSRLRSLAPDEAPRWQFLMSLLFPSQVTALLGTSPYPEDRFFAITDALSDVATGDLYRIAACYPDTALGRALEDLLLAAAGGADGTEDGTAGGDGARRAYRAAGAFFDAHRAEYLERCGVFPPPHPVSPEALQWLQSGDTP